MTRPDRDDLKLLRRWIAARVRAMLRNPRATFFTFIFPLLFLVIFSALNGNTHVDAVGPALGKVRFAQFYAPSIGIFGLTMACYSGVIFGIATARDNGLLKRVRGTPLPMGTYIASWLTGAVLTGIAAVVLMFVVGVPAFGVHIYASMLPAALVTLVLGGIALGGLGLAVATLARTADQAMPLAQLTFLPLSFISGVFYPVDGAPGWLDTVSNFFPLRHIVETFDACFVPGTPHAGWSGGDLLTIAIWGAVGFVVAARRFRWEPEPARRRRSPIRLGWSPR
jgi:ABC-2 type transport system permease protein